jgi:hypothetical protein
MPPIKLSLDTKNKSHLLVKLTDDCTRINFHIKHIYLNGATPVGKLCVSAVNIRCDFPSTILKLLASFELLGRKCFTMKPSMALQSEMVHEWIKNAIRKAS